MGYIPAARFYVRNDTLYQAGQGDGTCPGGLGYAKLHVSSFLNLTKRRHAFDVPAMNAFLGVGAGISFINLHVLGNLPHVDRTAACRCSPCFALAASGYPLAQTTPEAASGTKLGSFATSFEGLGPSPLPPLRWRGKDVLVVAI